MALYRSYLLAALLVGGCSDDDTSPPTNSTNAVTTASDPTTAPTTVDPTGAGTDEPTGGTTGGTAGGTTGGTTGTSEASGGSTTGGGGAGGFCQEACEADSDCRIDGVDQGYVCSEGRCRPSGTPAACSTDLFCQILLGGGLAICESSDECGEGRVCVKLESYSAGGCPRLSDGMGGCPDNHVAATLPLLEGGEAEVCIALGIFCDDVSVFPPLLYCNPVPEPCRSDTDCEQYQFQPICGGDGSCVCTTDDHCAAAAGHTSCVDGRCACTSDQDCAGLASADTCVDGVCGCGSPAVCPTETVYDGTQYICEPL